MTRLALLIIATFPFLPLQGQITLTNEVFPVVGDEFEISRDNEIEYTIIEGSDVAQTWDFTDLVVNAERTDTVFAASTGIFADTFPTATLVRTGIQGREEYLQVTDDKVLLLGYVQEFLGQEFPVVLQTPFLVQQAPMNYGDAFESEFSSNLAIALADYPLLDSLLQSLGTFQETFDSLRFISNTTYAVAADAFGTCTTPAGSFEVLRLKENTSNESAIEIHINLGFFGFWVDIGDFFADLSIPAFDISTNYTFQNDTEKTPIVKLFTNFNDEVLYVEFKSGISTATSEVSEPEFSAKIYPNPAVESIFIELRNKAARRLNLIDVFGREAAQYDVVEGQSSMNLEVGHLARGQYFIRIFGTNMDLLESRKLLLQ